jgi:hypothetical protein
VKGGRLKIVNSEFEKRKNLFGRGVSAVNKVYRRGAETLRGFLVVEWGRIDGGGLGDRLKL